MPEPLTILTARLADPWVGGALAFGFAVGALTAWWRGRAVARRAAAAGAETALWQRAENTRLEHQLHDLRRGLAVAEARSEQLGGQLAEVRDDLRGRIDALGRHRAREAELGARLDETRRRFDEKEAEFKREFEILANRIFERHGEQHQARLDMVLTPFKEQLGVFRQRVEAVYDSETRERASLLAEVRNLQQASDRINQEAGNLTRALKGDVRAQGHWGEMVLERVLESSGLRAGEEYFVQSSRRDREGALKRPDVLIRLPEDKDVVVDAKLSLLAYEEALAEEDEARRSAAIARHVGSLRTHVRRLAAQDYDRLPDVRSLDFVLMFVPIEAAFTMAMENDQRLFTEAFERRIVIVSPTTLMMTLRIINNVWRYEKQNRNAQEIARRAGALYDKLRGFVEDMETLGRQLTTLENTYQQTFAKLSTGKGNLLRRAEEFRELGAPVKRGLPSHLLEDDELADQSPGHIDVEAEVTVPEPRSEPKSVQEDRRGRGNGN